MANDFQNTKVTGWLRVVGEYLGILERHVDVAQELLVQAPTVTVDFLTGRAKTIDLNATAVIFDLVNFPTTDSVGYCTLEMSFTDVTLPGILFYVDGAPIVDADIVGTVADNIPDLTTATVSGGSAIIQISRGRLGFRIKAIEII